MNKRILLPIILCAGIVAGCTDDDDSKQQIPPTTGFGNRLSGLTAVITQPTDAHSLTTVPGTVWLAYDALTVTDATTIGLFDIATGTNTTSGKFNGSLKFTQTPLYAIYPAVSSMTGTVAPAKIGTVQNAQSFASNDIRIGSCDKVLPADGSLFSFRAKAVKTRVMLDLTADNTYINEKVGSVKIVAEGINIAGDCPIDLTTPDAPLSGSANSVTYTFNEAGRLAEKLEFWIALTPCDMSKAASVLYYISTEHYSFIFSKRPDKAFTEGKQANINLILSEFTTTTNEIPSEGEVKITKELPALDLSANGTANSYIVDKEARCSFNATIMGNGANGIIPGGGFTDYLGNALSTSANISPVSAELLWQTTEGLISELKISDGIVTFNSSGANGNALIAVMDDQNKIMWSWHIWCTDKPTDLTYQTNKSGNSYTFMDRNLGATSALDEATSLGLAYQWGRKDPLPGSSKYYDVTEPTLFGKIKAVEIIQSDAMTGTIANAIQNPVTFFKSAGDWLAASNNYLWGNPQGEGVLQTDYQKSIYDPCPPGYKLPGKDAYSIFTLSGQNTTSVADHNVNNTNTTKRGWKLWYTAYGSGDQSWFPYNGCRYYNTGALNRGSYYYYWTCAPAANTKSCCLAFKNDWKEVNPLFTFWRSNGQVTRCVKE